MSEQVSDSAGVIDNTDVSRFELCADGWLGELVYHIRGDRLVLIHRGSAGAGRPRPRRQAGDRGWLERHPEAASRAVIDWGS